MATCKFCGNAANESSKYEFPTCEKHRYEIDAFFERKKEMQVEFEDMRELERFVKLNPNVVSCPCCSSGMHIHHWRKQENIRIPIFKCTKCGFMG